jgi:hypothetical protein
MRADYPKCRVSPPWMEFPVGTPPDCLLVVPKGLNSRPRVLDMLTHDALGFFGVTSCNRSKQGTVRLWDFERGQVYLGVFDQCRRVYYPIWSLALRSVLRETRARVESTVNR